MPLGSTSLKSLWKRALLRGVHYRDRHRRLDLMYQMTDPWDLDRPRERFRFAETNRLILGEFGRVGSLFEMGCGEGHQSELLAQVCDRLHGCDVSARAVERARSRVPAGAFSVGAIEDVSLESGHRYDLVVACEVLYYVADVPGTIRTMSQLGRSCFVTYYQTQRDRLDGLIAPPRGGGRAAISQGGDEWTAVWWRNP